jgi:hypothetical protein
MNCFSRIEYESRNYSWFNLNPNLIVQTAMLSFFFQNNKKISTASSSKLEIGVCYNTFKLVIKRYFYATTIITKLILIFGNQLGRFFQ